MALYKVSELLDFLNSLGISPKKGLSQNFLIDGNIIRKIVSTADVKKNDLVLEVGPGPGSLTEALLGAGANVMAVEKDTVLANALPRLKGSLEVANEDILKFDLDAHFKGDPKAKVIANLPYHLTTPILVQLIKRRDLFSTLVLMVQDEVARRFTAEPGTADYSSFTVFLNYYSYAHYAFKVSRNCFFPAPRVDSAIVVLNLREPPVVENEEGFFEMTRTAFEQRRKMLRASLRELYKSDQVTAALESIGCNPLARPEELSLEEFLKLFSALNEG